MKKLILLLFVGSLLLSCSCGESSSSSSSSSNSDSVTSEISEKIDDYKYDGNQYFNTYTMDILENGIHYKVFRTSVGSSVVNVTLDSLQILVAQKQNEIAEKQLDKMF